MRWVTRKRVSVLVLLIVCGAIVNVVVAWGLAICINLHEQPRSTGIVGDGHTRWQGMGFAGAGGYLFTSMWSPSDLEPYVIQQSLHEIVPAWSPAGFTSPFPVDETNQSKQHTDIIDARGWPMLSLLSWVEATYDTASSRERKAGIELKSWPQPLASGSKVSRQLPTRPIWPGFALNTIFYAAIMWLLFFAPFVLRRWRRIKRGRCVRCGYDLQGNAGGAKCPECGALR